MLLRELLKLATDDASPAWQKLMHEKDCAAGNDPTGRTKCKCDGAFIVREVRRALNGGKVYKVEMTCEVCGGDGIKKPEEFLTHGGARRCPTCHGRGSRKVEPPAKPELQAPS